MKMASKALDEFCGSKFWDVNETWYTDDPTFTSCFEQTVLVWIPLSFLWIFGIMEVLQSCWKRTRRRPMSILYVFQQSIVVVIAVLEALQFLNSFRAMDQDVYIKMYPVEYLAPGLKSVTFVLAFLLQHQNRSKVVRNSGVVFTFWLLTVICEAFGFRSALRNLPQHPSTATNYVQKITELITYPFVILEFLLHFFPDSKRLSLWQCEHLSEEPEASRVQCPEMLASFPSKLTFQWVWPLVKLGRKRPLEFSDVWNLNPEDESQHLTKQFNTIWKPVLRRCQECNAQGRAGLIEDNVQLISDQTKIKSRTANFLWAVTKANFWYFLCGSSLKLIYDLLLFVPPKLLDLLIQHVSSDEEKWKGYMYAIALFVVNITATLCVSHYFQRMTITAMRVRNAVVGAIYEKALVISNTARKESTTGEIVNLISVDIQRIVEMLRYNNGLWSSPLQIVLALYFLYQTLGVAVCAGVGTMVLLIPVNIVVAKTVEKLEVKQMKFKDQRVKLTNEILSGIKVLKLYAWEPSVEKQVNEIRAKELHILKISSYIDAFNKFVWYTVPNLVSLATFGTYVFINDDNVLDARKAFVALSLLNILRIPLKIMPLVLLLAVQARVSVMRITKFLNAEEIDPLDISHVEHPDDGAAITIQNGDFSWDEEQGSTLQNINFKVATGELVAVVGAVGSGKSSLLAAVLGEIQKTRGSVNTVGSLAFVAQQAWIQNATLRDNVLFGREYNGEAYDSVIESCALLPDIQILPAGDRTEIGEKGINLSGGQKQRVALARATYSNADVFLLDDPLSAVDSHVGKHLFEKVIGPEGMLKNKTRIMVTHSVFYLPNVDNIFVMSEGEISESGNFQELMQKKGAFSEFLAQHAHAEDLEALGISASKPHVETDLTERRQSKKDVNDWEDDIKKKDSDRLIVEEKAEIGNVNRNVYLYYLKSAGWDIGILTLTFHLLAHDWSSETPSMNRTEDVAKRNLYLGVYGGLGLGQAISIFVATLSMSLGSIRAARYFHTNMLHHILRSPMTFFDTTPIGRIVNRFSKDINSVDSTFPTTLRTFMNRALDVFFTLVVISYSTPIFLLAIVPIAVLYSFIQWFYIITSCQLKRLESVSISPIYSHFSETLTGTATIRAFNSQGRFVSKAFKAVDANQMVYYASLMSNRWLAVRLQGLGNVIVFLSALFAVYAHPSAGIVGLSVSYSFNITDALNALVLMSSQVEADLVAVERIKEYGETPQEAAWEIPQNKPPMGWPNEGKIDFKNYQARYREGLDLALKHVSFHIKSGEKVGIVGRTGAGKSSVTLSLFRLIEAAGGSIEIDGINISSVGLHDLRRRLTVIPQDPVLFSGSIRLNLDPFDKYTDDEIWCALGYAHLKEHVSSLESGLDYEVREGGENLSVGQRQLVCLARALLRKSKVLVLDEATAAVDLETDDLIQQTIRNKFEDCTILTIAHRLNTIMDYDRILVLDRGEVLEFDSPGNLVKDQSSIFLSMAKDAGSA